MSKTRLAALLVGSLLALAACDSAEERAQAHFERSLELLQEGDVARAIVELRNVFQLDDSHRDARILMAELQEERGNAPGAYGEYRAVTESDPEDLEAQRAAARLAAELGDWDAAERHAAAASALLEEGESDPVLRAVELGLAYQQARRDQDLAAAGEIADETRALLRDNPEVIMARRILIDDSLFRQDWETALDLLDAGLEQLGDERTFHTLRLGVLERLGRTGEVEAQLRDMVERFPEDESLRQTLVRWYISQDRPDDAEAYLREQIDPEDPEPDSRVTLIAFLRQLRGAEAARAEIERILEETGADDPNRPLYRSIRAGLMFDGGERDAAIAEMEDILEGAEPSDQTRRIKIALARMLVATGSPVGARALVEEVLEEDATNVEALKMRANWMIEDDRPDEALVELRSALDQAPRDPGVLTLMARAQERAGSRDLMGEMLALAVEASNAAPEESLRYASFLTQENRLLPAEDVLIDALRLQPGNLRILAALGDIYMRLEDWSRAQGIIDALTGLESEEASAVADELTARLLAAQERQSELQSFLERLADSPEGNNAAIVSAVRLRLAENDLEGAVEYLQERLAEDPDNPDLRFVSAGLLAMQGEWDEARSTLESLRDEFPRNERIRLALYNLLLSQGAMDEAERALTEALEEMPDSPNLNWARAVELERAGNIEGAIAIYETLYEQNTNSAVVANNLASLLSSSRDDEKSLQRAYAIARRLRGTDQPAFQETYGWIAARLGNHEEALDYLEPAAEALPEEPTVRFHLAETYAMAGRDEDALKAYRETAELIEATSYPLPFEEDVAEAIARLEKEAAPAEN